MCFVVILAPDDIIISPPSPKVEVMLISPPSPKVEVLISPVVTVPELAANFIAAPLPTVLLVFKVPRLVLICPLVLVIIISLP